MDHQECNELLSKIEAKNDNLIEKLSIMDNNLFKRTNNDFYNKSKRNPFRSSSVPYKKTIQNQFKINNGMRGGNFKGKQLSNFGRKEEKINIIRDSDDFLELTMNKASDSLSKQSLIKSFHSKSIGSKRSLNIKQKLCGNLKNFMNKTQNKNFKSHFNGMENKSNRSIFGQQNYRKNSKNNFENISSDESEFYDFKVGKTYYKKISIPYNKEQSVKDIKRIKNISHSSMNVTPKACQILIPRSPSRRMSRISSRRMSKASSRKASRPASRRGSKAVSRRPSHSQFQNLLKPSTPRRGSVFKGGNNAKSKLEQNPTDPKFNSFGTRRKDSDQLQFSLRVPEYVYKFNLNNKASDNKTDDFINPLIRKSPVFQREIIRSNLESICERLENLSDLIYGHDIYDKIIVVHKSNQPWVKTFNRTLEETLSLFDFSSKELLYGTLKSLVKRKLLNNPMKNNKLFVKKSEDKILMQNLQQFILFEDFFKNIYEGYKILTSNPNEVYFMDKNSQLILITLDKILFNCNMILQEVKILQKIKVYYEPVVTKIYKPKEKTKPKVKISNTEPVKHDIIKSFASLAKNINANNITNNNLILPFQNSLRDVSPFSNKDRINSMNSSVRSINKSPKFFIQKSGPGSPTNNLQGSKSKNIDFEEKSSTKSQNPYETETTQIIIKPRIVESDENEFAGAKSSQDRDKLKIYENDKLDQILEVVKILNKKKFKFLFNEQIDSVQAHYYRRMRNVSKINKQFNQFMLNSKHKSKNELDEELYQAFSKVKRKTGDTVEKQIPMSATQEKMVKDQNENIKQKKPYEKHNYRISKELVKIIS